jgi:hypothetical protein
MTDQTTNNSPFYVMWVVGYVVQKTTCMSRFLANFCGQFRTTLYDHDIQERNSIISFNFDCEFIVGLRQL